MTPEQRAYLDEIIAATGCTVQVNDPRAEMIEALDKAGYVKPVAYGTDWTAYKATRKAQGLEPTPTTHQRTTDSATPLLTPAGSNSGMIPPPVTADPRITRSPRTEPR